MPYYFLSDKAADVLREGLVREIDDLDDLLRFKKAIWNDLGNAFSEKDIVDTLPNAPLEIPGHGRIMPQEMGAIPDALKDIAKRAMDEHNHVHVESGGDDGRVQPGQKSQAEINPVPQSSDSSAPGSRDPKKLEPLNLTKADPKPEEKHNRWAGVQFLRKEDVLIPKFEFDKDKKQFFNNIFFAEETDGRVAIIYGESTYCTTKDRVLGIPYPFPQKYFDTKRGWNSTIEQAIKKYRRYLAEKNDPDQAFRPMLNTNTRPNLDEEKVEGDLE